LQRGNLAPQADVDTFGKVLADGRHPGRADKAIRLGPAAINATITQYADLTSPTINQTIVSPGPYISGKTFVVDGKVLGAMIKRRAALSAPRCHAPSDSVAFLEHRNGHTVV
jgi:hypothetical protein